MSQDMLHNARFWAYKLIGAQLSVVLLLTLLYSIFLSWHAGYSALLGGLACVLPSIYFARKFFAKKAERTTRQIIKDFYIGELTKLIFSAILLILLFKYVPIVILPCLTGYIGAVLAFFLAPLIVKG